jgi:hypothetical protein
LAGARLSRFDLSQGPAAQAVAEVAPPFDAGERRMSLAVTPFAPKSLGWALLTASIALFGYAMAPRLWIAALYGPICSGHGAAFALHCPACWAAAGTAVLGSAMLLAQSRARI